MSTSNNGEGFVEMILKGAALALGAGVTTMLGRRLFGDERQVIVVVDRESLCHTEGIDEIPDTEAEP